VYVERLECSVCRREPTGVDKILGGVLFFALSWFYDGVSWILIVAELILAFAIVEEKNVLKKAMKHDGFLEFRH